MTKKHLVICTLNPVYSGSERLMHRIFESDIIKEHYNITILIPALGTYKSAFNQDLAVDDVNVKTFNEIPLIKTILVLKKGGFFRAFLRFLYLASPIALLDSMRLAFKISTLNPDVIHLNNGGLPGNRTLQWAAFWIKSLSGDIHIVSQFNNLPERKRINVLDKLALKSCDVIFCHSKKNKNILNAISNGLKVQAFMSDYMLQNRLTYERVFDHEKIELLSVGLLVNRKNHRSIIQSFIESSWLRNNARYHIIGDGDLKEELKELIDKYNLSSSIILHGYREDYSRFIEDCDLFVHPSDLREDLPLVLLEAGYKGIPIAATAIDGLVSWFPNGSWFALEEHDSLVQILSDSRFQVESNLRAKKAQNFLTNYSISNLYDKSLLKIYGES